MTERHTSKIGVFDQHIDASDTDVELVIETLRNAGFGVEKIERTDDLKTHRDDPYYVIHTPTPEALKAEMAAEFSEVKHD
jgi:hypothetical protein